MSRPNQIIDGREDDNEACHDNTVIHVDLSYVDGGWPKAEEENNEAESDTQCIVENAEDAGKTERSPDQGAGLGAVGWNFKWRSNRAGTAAPEEKRFHDDVGCVEGGDRKGDDGVEGGGGADVDESDYHA